MNSTRTPRSVNPKYELPKVIQVAPQPVHRVAHHGVTVPDESKQRRELRPLDILPRCAIDEATVELNSVELPVFSLVERTHADIAHSLPF